MPACRCKPRRAGAWCWRRRRSGRAGWISGNTPQPIDQLTFFVKTTHVFQSITMMNGAPAMAAKLTGDTTGNWKTGQAGNQNLALPNTVGTVVGGGSAFGDAGGNLTGGIGGNDTLTGGSDAPANTLYGDAFGMSGSGRGGNDILKGGDIAIAASVKGAAITNVYAGDAQSMTGNTQGGNDTIAGGIRTENNPTSLFNYLYGDAVTMASNSRGGNDSLLGGAFADFNTGYGDASSMTGSAIGGSFAPSIASGARYDTTVNAPLR